MGLQCSSRSTCRWLRIRPRLVALVLALASSVLPVTVLPLAVRADGPLEVLQVGWDGTVVPNTWSPVRVRVTGSAADLSARVEVILKSWYQPGPQSARVEAPVGSYGQEVPLPAGVTKEVTIWVPTQGNMVGTVQVVAGGQILAQEQVEFRNARAPIWPLIGVLAEAPTVARLIEQIELPFQGLPLPLDVARLSAEDLPPSAARLDALSALFVQGSAATALTGEQRRTVEDWVRSGGHLILAGGPDAPRVASALPSGVLPIRFTGVDALANLTALAQWAGVRESPLSSGPAALFRASSDGLLSGTPDRPLAWRTGLGAGTVTLLASDPALQPLASWSGTPALLQQALEPALPKPGENEKLRYMQMEQRSGAMRLQGVVEILPGDVFPGWQTIALVLGGFALVVGPLIHFLLWRVDRREWVWLVVPAIALLATAALYVVGVGREGRDVLANVIAHVRLEPDSGQSHESLAAGFYAPTHPDLVVTVPGDVPVRVVSQGVGAMYGRTGVPIVPDQGARETDPPFRVLSGRDTRVEFSSGEWAMRTVVMEQSLGAEVGHITPQLGVVDGLIKGTLRNDTPYTIEDAAIVVGQSLAKLGTLAPGQTVAAVLDVDAPMSPSTRGGLPLSYRLFGRAPEGLAMSSQGGAGQVRMSQMAVPIPAPPYAASSAPGTHGSAATPGASAPRPAATLGPAPSVPPVRMASAGVSERLELPRDAEVRRRARLFDAIVNVPRAGPGDQALSLTFLGFVQTTVGKSAPTAGTHVTYHLTLLEQPLRLELAPGPFTLPGSLSPAEAIAQSSRGMGGGGNGVIDWVEIYDGSITYGYHPPLPTAATVEALVVTTRQVGPATPMAASKGGPPAIGVGPGPAEAGVFTVYNWQSASWDALPAGQEASRLQAAPYLGSDGQVKIQVTSPADHSLRFLVPEVTVEGTVEG